MVAVKYDRTRSARAKRLLKESIGKQGTLAGQERGTTRKLAAKPNTKVGRLSDEFAAAKKATPPAVKKAVKKTATAAKKTVKRAVSAVKKVVKKRVPRAGGGRAAEAGLKNWYN
jgi:hypothetical protein